MWNGYGVLTIRPLLQVPHPSQANQEFPPGTETAVLFDVRHPPLRRGIQPSSRTQQVYTFPSDQSFIPRLPRAAHPSPFPSPCSRYSTIAIEARQDGPSARFFFGGGDPDTSMPQALT